MLFGERSPTRAGVSRRLRASIRERDPPGRSRAPREAPREREHLRCGVTPVASSQEVVVAGRPDVEPSIDGPVVASTHARTPVHYVIIPASQSIEAHAERAGARADQWRQDVFDDLATGGEVRIIPRETHSHDGAQVGITRLAQWRHESIASSICSEPFHRRPEHGQTRSEHLSSEGRREPGARFRMGSRGHLRARSRSRP